MDIIRESSLKNLEYKKSAYKIFEKGNHGSGSFGIRVPQKKKKGVKPPVAFIFRCHRSCKTDPQTIIEN